MIQQWLNRTQGQALTRRDFCSFMEEPSLVQVRESPGKCRSVIIDVYVLWVRLLAEVFRAMQTKHTASRTLTTRCHCNLNTICCTVDCTDRLDRKRRPDEKVPIASHTFRSCVHLYQGVSERQADASFVRSYILLNLKVSAYFPSSFPRSWAFP